QNQQTVNVGGDVAAKNYLIHPDVHEILNEAWAKLGRRQRECYKRDGKYSARYADHGCGDSRQYHPCGFYTTHKQIATYAILRDLKVAIRIAQCKGKENGRQDDKNWNKPKGRFEFVPEK